MHDFELAHIENLKAFLAKAKEENIRVEVNNCKLGAKVLYLEEQLKAADLEIDALKTELWRNEL